MVGGILITDPYDAVGFGKVERVGLRIRHGAGLSRADLASAVGTGKHRQAHASVTMRRKRDASAGTGYLFSYWV